jgi:hypothetical protein
MRWWAEVLSALSVGPGTHLWYPPVATIVLKGHFADSEWILTVGWRLALLVMAVACLVKTHAAVGGCMLCRSSQYDPTDRREPAFYFRGWATGRRCMR